MDSFILHLMRHGAPETPGLMMGRTNGAPSADGIAACMAAAEKLAVDAIVSSDLARAVVPANAIAEARLLPHAIDPRWRELDFGAWDGLAASDVDSAALARFWADPDAHCPPEGERWSALVARVGAAIAALAPCPTLVVTHGGAMRAALASLCGLGFLQGSAFDLPYAARLSLRVWPGEPRSAQIVALWS